MTVARRGAVQLPWEPRDIASPATVQEESIDSVRQIRAGHVWVAATGDLFAKCIDVLRPTGYKRRLVDRSIGGQPDEGGCRGTHALNWPWSRIDFFYVHARRQVFGHQVLLSRHARPRVVRGI